MDRCIDHAVTTGRALGPHGLAHRLMSEADHVARFGAGRAPIADPGPYLGGDAAAVANHTRALKIFDLQQRLDPILELDVETGYPDNIRSMMMINTSLRHLTLEAQFDFLRANLSLTKQDIQRLVSTVSAPWTPGMKIETHVNEQR